MSNRTRAHCKAMAGLVAVLMLLPGLFTALRADAATLHVTYCNGGEIPIHVAVIASRSGSAEQKIEGWWTFDAGTGFGRECPKLIVGDTRTTYRLIIGFRDFSGNFGAARNLESEPPHVFARSDLWYCVNTKAAFARVGSEAELRSCAANEVLMPAPLEIRVDPGKADRDQHIELKHRAPLIDTLSKLRASCERAITNATIRDREDYCRCMAFAVQNSHDAAGIAALSRSWDPAHLDRLADHGTYQQDRGGCPKLDPNAPVPAKIAVVSQLPPGAYVFALRSNDEKHLVSLAQAMSRKNYRTIVRQVSAVAPQFDLFLGPYPDAVAQAEVLAELKRVGFTEAVPVQAP